MSKWFFWAAVLVFVWGGTYVAKTVASQSNIPSVKGFFGAL